MWKFLIFIKRESERFHCYQRINYFYFFDVPHLNTNKFERGDTVRPQPPSFVLFRVFHFGIGSVDRIPFEVMVSVICFLLFQTRQILWGSLDQRKIDFSLRKLLLQQMVTSTPKLYHFLSLFLLRIFLSLFDEKYRSSHLSKRSLSYFFLLYFQHTFFSSFQIVFRFSL